MTTAPAAFARGRDDAKAGTAAETIAAVRARFPEWSDVLVDAYLNGVETGRAARETTMQTQHTPGIASGNPDTCLDCVVLPPFSIRLCALHAAAPALYEALRAMLEYADAGVVHKPTRESARAALAAVDGAR